MKSSSDIKQILDYLRELQVNNDRSWFKSHKERYDALRQAWERDMERLITLVGQWDDNVRGLMVRDCVYRIYRDTRFSANKAPYKNYFKRTSSTACARSSTPSPRNSSTSHSNPTSHNATTGNARRSRRCRKATPWTTRWRNSSK